MGRGVRRMLFPRFRERCPGPGVERYRQRMATHSLPKQLYRQVLDIFRETGGEQHPRRPRP